jgi:DNA repair exonuclease SbcCD ATPase subunit
LLQAINEHKPLVDKLNKTGGALTRLCGEEDAAKVQGILESDNQRYNALKSALRARQQALEEAMQETSKFTDKLDGMLSALANTADQVNNAEPISAHPGKIQEQIAENAAILEDLDKRKSAYDAVKKAADDMINKAGPSANPAVRDIKAKLTRLNSLWNHIQNAGNNRGKSLDDALALAEKFWDELQAIMQSLKELERTLSSQDPPAVEPTAIQQQKSALEDIKHEIQQAQPEVEECRKTGRKLMTVCGEPDKPEVKKHIEDLDSAWENVTSLYARREQNLIDAMEKSMEFHDMLQKLLDFLDNSERKFERMGALGADIDAVKDQIRQLKDFKSEVDPQMVKVEALNRQAQELTARTSPDQATRIKKPVADVNRRWDDLLKAIVDRQRALEHALLRLGQFQHALEELLVWINRTEKTLDSLQPVLGDPAVIEVELAKLKVLVNDIHAHQSSVDTLNDAGRQLIESEKGSQDATTTQRRLNELNNRWNGLQNKAEQRQSELEAALREAQAFNAEIQDLLLWLGDIDSALASSKPVGGLPETAKEQLTRFMEVYDELEKTRPKVDSVLQQGQGYLKRSTEGAASNLQHNLKTLKQRWDSVLNRANDKKIKLEIALKEATEFHDALQAFVDWLTKAESILGGMHPVSRVMETILQQIEDHKAFQKDVGAHREIMLNLDKKGTHLKYFSQKQDVILIKNLLISVQHRWERVVSKSAERTRALDHGYKEAKEFHDAWTDLCAWLDNAKVQLDEMTATLGNDPEKIKVLLNKHKEFQRQLGTKQPAYDATMKAGRVLKDKSPKSDHAHLQEMLNELKNKWNSVCTNSVDRQRKLEEALLFTGQFKDAIGALLDWLKKAEKELSKETPVHGDLDTVMALVEQHNTFQGELDKRAGQVSSVKSTAEELLKSASVEDASTIRNQTRELSSVWEKVVGLADGRQRRLSDALKQAEELHKAVHMLLEWLSDAEMKLRFAGPLPDSEEETQQQLSDHRK